METENRIHIGTSGWSYKHWAGLFYPPGMKSGDYLSYYAQHFKVSELNRSFYRLPMKSTVKSWIETVPDDFLFCPKMSRYLSHLKKLHDPEEPLERFFHIFDPFQKHLGPVLMQLPPGLRFDEKLVIHFYKLLNSTYADYRFAIEIRHESWLTQASISLMKTFGIILVIAQSEKYPYCEELTAADVFVRFHGPRELYSSSYSDSALEGYAKRIVEWKNGGHSIWAFFNNDIHGHALANAATLQRYVDKLT